MGQVAIHVEEQARQAQNWSAFFAEIDRVHPAQEDDCPSLEQIRASEVPDVPREAF